MNTPNPLVPQGSLQQSKGKSNVRIAVFTILAIHVVLLCGLLIQGCKPKPPPVVEDPSTNVPILEPMTNTTDLIDTNLPPIDTNTPVPPVTVPGATGQGSVTAPVPPPVVAPVTTEPTTPVAETRVHVVAKGESLSTIAQKEHVSLKALQEANPTVEPTKLQIGQKLNVPAANSSGTSSSAASTGVSEGGTSEIVYTVKAGDALEKIARNHNTTVKAIKQLNGMKTDRINVGQKLKIPSSQPAADTAPAPTTNR